MDPPGEDDTFNYMKDEKLALLWLAADEAAQNDLSLRVAHLRLYRSPSTHILATKLRHLKSMSITGPHMELLAPLEWSEVTPTLEELDIILAPKMTQSFFSIDVGTLFPNLTTLDVLTKKPLEHQPFATLPATLKNLLLENEWRLFPFGSNVFSPTFLPRSLTSLHMVLTPELCASCRDWPSTLTVMSITMRGSGGSYSALIANLPQNLLEFNLYGDCRVAKVHDMAALPRSLTNLNVTFFLSDYTTRDVFLALPRQLKRLELNDPPFEGEFDEDEDDNLDEDEDVDEYEGVREQHFDALPTSLESLTIGYGYEAMEFGCEGASKLPRSMTRICATFTADSLPHLPHTMQRLKMTDSPKNSLAYWSGFTNLVKLKFLSLEQNSPLWDGIGNCTKLESLKVSGRGTTDVAQLVNLPHSITDLRLNMPITNVSLNKEKLACWSSSLPGGLLRLDIETETSPALAWWSSLPKSLTSLQVSVSSFDMCGIVALSSACTGLISADVHIAKHADFGDVDSFVGAVPKTLTCLLVTLGEDATYTSNALAAIDTPDFAFDTSRLSEYSLTMVCIVKCSHAHLAVQKRLLGSGKQAKYSISMDRPQAWQDATLPVLNFCLKRYNHYMKKEMVQMERSEDAEENNEVDGGMEEDDDVTEQMEGQEDGEDDDMKEEMEGLEEADED